jgi:hypothetical protein
MKKVVAIILIECLVITGCSTSSKDIAPISASPLQYKSFDCEQIASESIRLSGRISQLGGRLDEAAASDKAIAGVGLILFWPALFALGGTKQQEAEYAKVKGEYEALQQASMLRKCTIEPIKKIEASADQR